MAYDDRELSRRLHEAAEAVVVPDRPLRTRSRAVPLLAGAVATALVLILAVAVGQYLGGRGESPNVLASPTPTPSQSAAASPSPSASPTPAPTSDPTVATYVRPLVTTWRPTTTTVIVQQRVQSGRAPNEVTLVAVPSDGSASTSLVRITNAGGADVRRDGSALVASIGTVGDTSRLAIWDLRGGTLRWLTADEPGIAVRNPLWSADGSSVYFGRGNANGGDIGLFKIAADGSGLTRIRGPVAAPQVSVPKLATEDGLLVWGAAYEGASIEVLDLTTGREYSSGMHGIEAVRPTGPRFLLSTGGGTFCCAGLVMWDHLSDSKRVIAAESTQVMGMDWGTDGRSFVAAMRDAPTGRFQLRRFDEGAGAPTALAGTEDANWPLWLRAGIVYLHSPVRDASLGIPGTPSELRIVSPQGGDARALYRAPAGEILFMDGYVTP